MWYAIQVRGQLESRWSAWFDGMTVAAQDETTTLISGPVADQAALHGLLAKIRDLGLTLVSVQLVEEQGKNRRESNHTQRNEP